MANAIMQRDAAADISATALHFHAGGMQRKRNVAGCCHSHSTMVNYHGSAAVGLSSHFQPNLLKPFKQGRPKWHATTKKK